MVVHRKGTIQQLRAIDIHRTVKSRSASDLIGPLYNLQTFERKYTDITRMRGACWMVPLK